MSQSRDRLAELTAATWALGAAAATAEGGVPPELEGPVREVLVKAGLEPEDLPLADLRMTLLQVADLVDRSRERTLTACWAHTDPLLLQAQGEVSAQPVGMLVDRVFPMLGLEVMDFLDVGAGVGAMCIELCRRLPGARAVGLEPAEAPLALARRNVAEAGLEDRIELRQQLVQELDDEAAYDVAWLASMFMPRAVVADALTVLHRAVRPGGIVLSGTIGEGDDGLAAAAGRLRAALWGAEVRADELETLAREAGFADVMRGPPQGVVTPVILRR
jgi:2-polyprenyl-3-methyl-5-hydroxy-6-metoxy-1,4-benzoquinol methylase